MTKADAEEFTQSLGQIVGGSWRQIAWAKQQGIPKALGLTTEAWVRERLGGYVKLTVEDRRKAVNELVDEGESQRGIAEIVGVGETTIRRDIKPSAPFGATDKPEALENNDLGSESAPFGAEADTVDMEDEKTVEHAQEAIASDTPVDAIAALAHIPSKNPHTIAEKHTGDHESYTPEVYIMASRAVMGDIDIDPASNAFAQKVVKAATWHGAEDNGLTKVWSGRVFLNPPYAYPIIESFIDKLLEHYSTGEVSAAILLTNNNTDTAWWQAAAQASRAVCYTKGRISFYKADGKKSQPTNGQTFFYFGKNVDKFREVFTCFGLVGTFQ